MGFKDRVTIWNKETERTKISQRDVWLLEIIGFVKDHGLMPALLKSGIRGFKRFRTPPPDPRIKIEEKPDFDWLDEEDDFGID